MASNIATREGENRILRTVARQRLRPGDASWLASRVREVDWPSLAERAFQEGLAPFLYGHLRGMGLIAALPPATATFLSRIYAETSLLNQHLIEALADLDKALSKRGLQVILFKGMALLRTVYRDPALRPMEDIDLIVRQGQTAPLKEALEEMGFAQKRLYPEGFAKGILAIDVHRSFTSSERIGSREEVMDVQMDEVWENAVPVGESASLLVLAFNDQMVALSYHLLKHRYGRLIWLADILEILEAGRPILDWERLTAHCRRMRADKIVLYALLMAQRLLGCGVPEKVLIGLGRDDLSAIERHILRLRLLPDPPGTMMDLLWLFQLRTTGKKVRFIGENLFPRGEVMDQIFPGSSHRAGTRLMRLLLVGMQILSDLSRSLKVILKSGLPPL